MTPPPWTLVDQGVITALLASGWKVDKLKTQRIEENVVMVWKAFRWPWLVLAPDTAALWDITRELEQSKRGGESRFKRYRVERFTASTWGLPAAGPMPR